MTILTKQDLAELIEAYAAAHRSGNPMLLKFAANNLAAFMQQVEIVPAEATEASASQ